MIDFNGKSTRIELFYTDRLGNHLHCIFIFTFFVLLFKSFHFNYVLNSDRKKTSLTSRVSYVGGKQAVHLCLKVNKTRQKCLVNCAGGMPEGNMITKNVWASGKLYHRWRFSTLGEIEGASRRVTRRHAVQGVGLMLDNPGFRGREKPKLYEISSNEEVRIKCLEIMQSSVKKQAR